MLNSVNKLISGLLIILLLGLSARGYCAEMKPNASAQKVFPVKTDQGPKSGIPAFEIFSLTGWDKNFRDSIQQLVFYGNIDLGKAMVNLRKASTSLQESFLRGLLQIGKQYASTSVFQEDYLRERARNGIKNHEENKDFPISSKEYIRKALQNFMAESGTVDFTAETEIKDGTVIFVNSEYENKSYLWKQCFRAGSNHTIIVQEFCSDWLASFDR